MSNVRTSIATLDWLGNVGRGLWGVVYYVGCIGCGLSSGDVEGVWHVLLFILVWGLWLRH